MSRCSLSVVRYFVPRVRIELTTLRSSGESSTTELPRRKTSTDVSKRTTLLQLDSVCRAAGNPLNSSLTVARDGFEPGLAVPMYSSGHRCALRFRTLRSSAELTPPRFTRRAAGNRTQTACSQSMYTTTILQPVIVILATSRAKSNGVAFLSRQRIQ